MACHSLSKVTIRACDIVGEANRAAVDHALGDIFPLLLEKGMASPAKEVMGIRWVGGGEGEGGEVGEEGGGEGGAKEGRREWVRAKRKKGKVEMCVGGLTLEEVGKEWCT